MSGFKSVLFAIASFYFFVCVIAQEDRTLVINSHESLSRVYVDGILQFLPNANYPNETDNVTVAFNSRLVAVQAISTIDNCAGFIGSIGNDYFLTDASWKCSGFGGLNWYDLGYPDQSWLNAYEVGLNGIVQGCPNLEYFPDISLAAQWIWTPPLDVVVVPDPDAVDRAVFCRGYIPFCSTYEPCQNGGTCLENAERFCICPPDYTGQFCELPNTPCVSTPCQNNGTCTFTSDSYACTCTTAYTGFNCEYSINRTLTITAKTTLYDLFIDGEKKDIPNRNNWTTVDTITLTPINRLIAIMAVDSSEECAGLLASVTGDFLLTSNETWTCFQNGDLGWQDLGWDEAVWPAAYELGLNHEVTEPAACGTAMQGIPAISDNAHWIWTDSIANAPGEYHQTIYCRAYIPICEHESPCENEGICNNNNNTICTCFVGYIGQFCQSVDLKRLTLTAKEDLYAVYVDGAPVEITNGSDWQTTDSLTIRSISRLVAVMAIQLSGNCPGILVSVDDDRGDYVVSNASWKCSSSAPVGWAELGFDDSSWAAATVYRQNDISNDTTCEDLGVISSISPDAYWIWTDTSVEQDVAVHCRGILPICSVHPCQNGATCNANRQELCSCPSGFHGVYCQTADVIETSASAIFEEAIPASPAPARKSEEPARSHLHTLLKSEK